MLKQASSYQSKSSQTVPPIMNFDYLPKTRVLLHAVVCTLTPTALCPHGNTDHETQAAVIKVIT